MNLATLLVRTSTRSAGHAPPGDAEAALLEEQIEQILSDPSLHDDEAALLANADEHDPEALLDLLTETRLCRALDTISTPEESPRLDIRIARGEGHPGSDVSSVASELLETVRLPGIASRPCLLVTDGDGFAEISRTVPAAPDVAFLDADASSDEAMQATVTRGEPARVTVANVGTTLSNLQETIHKALPEDVRSRLDACAEDPHLGEILSGKYKLESTLGKGGFGTVYAGTDVILGAKVAIKLLNPRAASAQNALEDFLAEAKLLTTIDHENIVRWITFDRTEEGLHYFVMEYLRGAELQEVLEKEGSLSPARAQNMLLQILSALQRAHRLPDGGSLLHLDLKPPNVFVLERDHPNQPERVKVIDFGIGQHIGAQVLRQEASESANGGASGGATDFSLVGGGDPEQSVATSRSEEQAIRDEQGTIKRARGGTLLYASPEQCKHLAGMPDIVTLDGRADLYSFGIMAFKMLTGTYPFERGDSFQAVIRSHLEVPPKKVRSANPKVPRRLAAFVDQCLEKDRDRRWKDTDEAFEALERIVHPPRWRAVAAAVLPLVVVGLALAWFFWPDPPLESSPVYRLAGGERVSMENETLYVSSGQESTPLFLEGADGESIEGGSLKVIDLNTGEEVTRIAPRLGDDGWVTLGSTSGDAFFETKVFLEYDTPQATGRTQAFTVVGIAASAWTLDSVQVHDRELDEVLDQGLRVDPRNLALTVRLQVPEGFRRDHVASVKLGEAELEAPAMASSKGESLEYQVQLHARGVAELVREGCDLVVTDKAGNESRRPVQLELAPPLQVPTRSLAGGTKIAGGTLLVPESEARISLDASHDAYEVQWKLIPEPDLWGGKPPSGTFVAGEEPVLPLTDRKEHYSGVLSVTVVEQRARIVSSRATAETRKFELPLEFSPDRPSFSVSLVSANQGAPLTPEAAPVPLGRRTLQMVLRRNPEQKLRVRAMARVLRDGEEIRSAPPVDFEIGMDSQPVTLDLEGEGDGVYQVEVQGTRLDAGGGTVGEDAEFLARYEVRIDTEPPAITEIRSLEGVLRDRKVVPGIAIRDASFPARVSWSIPAVSHTGTQTTTEENGENLELDLPELPDGQYELEIQVTDGAGNTGSRETRPFEIAATDPTITWLQPIKRQDEWTPQEEGWEISTRVEDGNAIGEVTYAVTTGTGEGVRTIRTGALEEVSSGNWKATLPGFAPRDSGAQVTIHLEARDVHYDEQLDPEKNGATESKIDIKLPAIPLPQSITCTRDEAEMILVQGNAEATYFFGGRPGERKGKEWAVEFPPGTIESYYLDAQEVTNGQFLRFLKANRDGDARIAELERKPENLPVTDVRWADAHGYAGWAGKRLPSYVQWEYAVRGRDHRNPENRPQEEVNYQRAKRDDTLLWPRGQGADVIDGIWNLCGNVSEWTSNPWQRNFGTHARAHSKEVLQPWTVSGYEGQDRYWLVGGFQSGSSCSVFYAALAPRASLRPNQAVGFQCAVDASTVRDTVAGASWDPFAEKK